LAAFAVDSIAIEIIARRKDKYLCAAENKGDMLVSIAGAVF
jgi:hypothetical protein